MILSFIECLWDKYIELKGGIDVLIVGGVLKSWYWCKKYDQTMNIEVYWIGIQNMNLLYRDRTNSHNSILDYINYPWRVHIYFMY